MAEEAKGSERGPYRVQVVQGEPYEIGDRTLVPEAKIASYGRARATIGARRTGGWAVGLVQVKPLAILERVQGEENRILIVDATGRTLRLLLGAAVSAMVLFSGVRLLVRRQRRASLDG